MTHDSQVFGAKEPTIVMHQLSAVKVLYPILSPWRQANGQQLTQDVKEDCPENLFCSFSQIENFLAFFRRTESDGWEGEREWLVKKKSSLIVYT
jgi:hypothetical protein